MSGTTYTASVRYSTRVLLLQLATVVAVVAVCAGVFSWITYDRLRDSAADNATSIARSIAAAPQVREAVAARTGQSGRSDPADTPLQDYAADAAARTGALFVVVTDARGIRLAHPDPSLIGERVSTSHDAALRGEEVTAWESGTLGTSVRAKVPVFAPGTGQPVGEVSVGFRPAHVFSGLPKLLAAVGAAAAGAVVLGLAATVLMRRRWEHVTLGLQPEEMAELVRAQAAVLEGVDDGVLSLDNAAVVQLANSRAGSLLGVKDAVGRNFTDLGLPEDAVRDLLAGRSRDQVVVGDKVLYLDAHPVHRHGRPLGTVIVVRDRTDLTALSRRLGTVRALGGALRVQRHEFANRIHVAAGLLDAGRDDDARAFLREMEQRGPVDFPLVDAALLAEPFLQSFLGAKSVEAAERGVTLRVGPDTLVLGTVGPVNAVEDVATVLGNLVDNAVAAAAGGAAAGEYAAGGYAAVSRRELPETRGVSSRGEGARRAVGGPWVEVTALQDADSLVLTVADSGPGLAPAAGGVPVRATEAVSGPAQGVAPDSPDSPDPPDSADHTDTPVDRVHGHGIGLTLSRDLARRRNGELWLIDPGGDGTGAVFGVRLPGVFATETTTETTEAVETTVTFRDDADGRGER